MTEPLVLFRGELVPASAARIEIYDAGIVMGATVTDMARTFGKRLFRIEDHLQRFFASLHAIGLTIELSPRELQQKCEQLVARNTELVGDDDELTLCLFATAGQLARYAGHDNVEPGATLCGHTFPLSFELWREAVGQGVHLVTPDVRQIPGECIDPTIKHRSRLHYYLATKQVQAVSLDAVPLLLDLDGNVTETVSANLLIVANGVIVSPLAEKTLKGISMTVMSELADQLGIEVAHRELSVADVAAADEAFLSSTPYCLLPATRINDCRIGDGKPGPVLARLMAAWNELVGLDIHAQIQRGHSV